MFYSNAITGSKASFTFAGGFEKFFSSTRCFGSTPLTAFVAASSAGSALSSLLSTNDFLSAASPDLI